MITLLRGTKENWLNQYRDIRRCIIFLKENLSSHIGIYADGPSTCFSTLLLNITENENNELFDCSVLHEGLYDLSKIPRSAEFYFGERAEPWVPYDPLKM